MKKPLCAALCALLVSGCNSGPFADAQKKMGTDQLCAALAEGNAAAGPVPGRKNGEPFAGVGPGDILAALPPGAGPVKTCTHSSLFVRGDEAGEWLALQTSDGRLNVELIYGDFGNPVLKAFVVYTSTGQYYPPFTAPMPAADTPACAAEDMQLLYYYLEPALPEAARNYATDCHPGEKAVRLPGWLEKSLPAMHARVALRDEEFGDLSEAVVWQTAVSIVYDFNSRAAASAKPQAMRTLLADILPRYQVSLRLLSRAKPEGSFEGRGRAMKAHLDAIGLELAALGAAAAGGGEAKLRPGTEAVSRRSRALFRLLLEPAPPGRQK